MAAGVVSPAEEKMEFDFILAEIEFLNFFLKSHNKTYGSFMVLLNNKKHINLTKNHKNTIKDYKIRDIKNHKIIFFHFYLYYFSKQF